MAWIPIAASVAGAAAGALLNRNRGGGGTTTSSADPWSPTIPYLNELLAGIQRQAGTPAPYTSPDQMVAPLTPEQQQGAGMVTQGAQSAQALTGEAGQAILPFLRGQYMNADANPYLQQAIQAAIRPVTQNFQENVLPGISSGFSVGTDAYDQSREGIARGIASRSYLDTVGDISSRMQNRGYETGLEATSGAIGRVPGLVSAATAPGQAQWNIGALLQAQDQNVANAPGVYDQFLRERAAWPANIYTQIGQIGRQGTQVAPTAQTNPWLSGIGGAILGRQIYNMWPSSPTPQQPLSGQPVNWGSTGDFGGFGNTGTA